MSDTRYLLKSAGLPCDDTTVERIETAAYEAALVSSDHPAALVAAIIDVMKGDYLEKQARTIQPHPLDAIMQRCVNEAMRPLPRILTPPRHKRKRRARR